MSLPINVQTFRDATYFITARILSMGHSNVFTRVHHSIHRGDLPSHNAMDRKTLPLRHAPPLN